MQWLKTALEFFTNPIADLTGGYRERQKIAAESAAMIATAEVNLKIAEITASAKRFEMTEGNDSDYDLKVLDNRNRTLMDEIVIFTWLSILVMHFVTYTQGFMLAGWLAMGYQGVPWWFEFGMVGILVSTLGLMRLFRIMFERVKNGRIAV